MKSDTQISTGQVNSNTERPLTPTRQASRFLAPPASFGRRSPEETQLPRRGGGQILALALGMIGLMCGLVNAGAGTLSGRITSGGLPISGVAVSVTSQPGQNFGWNFPTTTDANGNWSVNTCNCLGATPERYRVTFSKAGVSLFMPSSYETVVPPVGGNLGGLDAVVAVGSLSGRITEGTVGVPGVTVSAGNRTLGFRSPNLAVPDNNSTGVSDTEVSTATQPIRSMRAWVAVSHTYIGDLQVILTHPDGTTCVLHNQTDTGTDTLFRIYPDTALPSESLTKFNGKPANGTWRITVKDLASQDTGYLVGWGFLIEALTTRNDTVTDANGNFAFPGSMTYDMDLVPSKIGVTFSPTVMLARPLAPANFAAVPAAPTITQIANQLINEDRVPVTLPFFVGDWAIPFVNLVVSATSSNPGLIPPANISLSGIGNSRSITFSPAPNANGTAVIQVNVSDGTLSASSSFTVVVAAVNDVPTLSALGPLNLNEDSSTTINFTVGDVDNPVGDLTIFATSTNQNLIPNASLVPGGSGTSRTLTLTPRANANGQSLIGVVVSDGLLAVTNSFLLTVNPANDLPIAGPQTGLRLNGINEYVETPSVGAGISGNAAHTLEMWVRPEAMFRGAFGADFNITPPGLTLGGSAAINGGYLRLTTSAGGQLGSATIADFGGGEAVTHFRASFRLALFGGTLTPADGFSFNLEPADSPFAITEEGTDTGLAVSFDTFDNGGGEAPAIEVKYRGAILKRVPFQPSSGSTVTDPAVAARKVIINLDPDGTIDVTFDGQQLISNLATGYDPVQIGTPKWVLAGRTGGLFENHWVDDLLIEAPARFGTTRSWLAQLGNPGSGSHHLLLTSAQNPAKVLLQAGIWGDLSGQVVGTPLDVNRWNHVAATWDPVTTNYTVYVNGFRSGGATPTLSRFNLTGVGLSLGQAFGESFFRGNIDEVRLWNRALSAPEILQNMNFPLTGNEPGLQIYQRFDEATGSLATDSAPLGGRNEGNLLNGATYGIAASAREPGTLRLDGVDDYVNIPNFGPLAPTTEVTVEFWQKVSALKPQSTFSLGPETPDNRFNAHVPWSDGVVYWDFGNWSAGIGRLTYTPPANSTLGVWQHWAFQASQSGNFMRIYRNGALVAQKTGMTPRTASGTADWGLKVGSLESAGPNTFAGEMAEFRIWNVIRSAAEIQANSQVALRGNEPGLLTYLRFHEGFGPTVANSGSTGRFGNISGNPIWGDPLVGNTNALETFGTLFVDEDTPTFAFLPGFDVEQYRGEGGLTFSVVTPPLHGTLAPVNGNWTLPAQNPVRYTPDTNYNGSDSFTYRVTDASSLASALYTVPIRVRDSDDAPTITSIADFVIEENTTSPSISFVVFDTDNLPSELDVDPESQDSSLIPASNVIITGTGTNRSFTITPTRDEVGTTLITLTVNDLQKFASTSFRVRVAPRPAYAILDLGTLPSRTRSVAAGLNNIAWTVGSAESRLTDTHGFLAKGIESGNTLIDLGTLGGPTAVTAGINDSNVITGFSTANSSANKEMFRWSNNVMSSLGYLSGNLPTEGRAINNGGKIAGAGDTPSGMRAFIHGGVYTNLGVLPGGTRSEAYGINESDEVAGYSTVTGGGERAFLHRNGTLVDLGVLDGHTGSRGLDVNNSRQVAGWSTTNSGVRRAVVFDGNTLARRDLGLLPDGSYSAARSINDFNQVVGQAGRAGGGNSAFLHSAGQLYDLNQLVPGEDNERWDLKDATAVNRDGFITGTGALSGSGGDDRAYLAVPAWVIGRPIPRPEGAVKRLPEIEVLSGPGTSQNSFFWSTVENRLYAIRPVTARLKWFTSFTDTVGSGTNTTINTDRIVTVGIAVWPRNPTLHVANSPTEVEPAGVPFDYTFQSVIYQTVDGVNVEPSTKRFTASRPGYAVLHYLKNNGFTPRPDVHPPVFDVVKTVNYDDPNYLTTTNWFVGTPLRHPAHTDYGGRNGYVYFTQSFYDGVGPDRAYDRNSRLGSIIPVNVPTSVTVSENNNLVVVWYSLNRLGVAWSGIPVLYSLSWPINAPKIIIASGKGSGPLDPGLFPEMRVYNQPAKNLPGYNPNEEHALIVPSDNGLGLYALRNDFNAGLKASAPFALLKYRDVVTGEWRIRPYSVVTEEGTNRFTYTGEAGKEIQPPFPLSVLTACARSYGVVNGGPWWEDVNGKIYARAAGPEGGPTNILVRWFYPLQPGFNYDDGRDGTNDLPDGTCIAWLDRSQSTIADGVTPGTPDVPIDVTYRIRWPDRAPTLQIGETLLNPRRGLPGVKNMAAVSMIYDDLNPTDANAIATLARFYDPISARTITLPSQFVWPTSIARQNRAGKEYFPGLPYALKVRLYHDPVNRQISFQGILDETGAGLNPLLLPNVISPRERDRIRQLADGNTAWANLIESLYDLTRNPNKLDLNLDTNVDRALLIGLRGTWTNALTGLQTNAVPEAFGDGPKALTAGLADVPPPPARPGYALQFNGSSSAVQINPPVSISTTFTEEAWVFPQPANASTFYGIIGSEDVTAPNRAPMLWVRDLQRVGYGFGDGSDYHVGETARILTTNAWNHLAATFDGAAYRIYLNGILAHTDTNFAGLVPSPRGVGYLGQRNGLDSFSGRIDEVRLWNVARSGAEIAATRGKRLNGAEDGLVGLWRFDEGAGNFANDAGQFARNGSLTQTTWINLESPGPAPAWGRPPRYITLAENNDSTLPGLPITLHVIRVDDGPYLGDVKVMPADNVFDERVSMRHSSDFGAAPERLAFEWYYKPDGADFDPTDLPKVDPVTGSLLPGQERGWIIYPVAGAGVNDITLGEGGESSLLTLGDNWFVSRYRGYNVNGDTNWSDWIGEPGGSPRAQLVEGWIKRVIRGLNPFDSRTTDFHSSPVVTFSSMLMQAGSRFEGPIAFNPGADNINNIGLIEAYATVLNRARNLSIDGVPAVNFDPANNALLLAASRISDLYMLLGNEAYADAQDPTIGFGTSSGEYGSVASSIFSFQNQLDSLLEEELVLLRGRDDRRAGVRAAPFYNRLAWNFTLGDGEVAYRQAYNIRDQNFDGFIDERDARLLFPQGHGDAWGHYLTAIKNYYTLLRHPNFTWKPRTEPVTVAGTAVEIDFQDERKFARIAAAKAKAGREIVELTYRYNYVEDPSGQWQGYKDTDSNRSWGVDEWARRAGQGAYLDWLAANTILPSVDPNPAHTGIEKIDRQTVVELREIAAQAIEVQARLDQADAGLNPVGIAKGSVPFDIDPTFLEVGSTAQIGRRAVQGLTQFDQILERAVKAVKNGVAVWDEANRATELLRRTQDTVDDFTRNVREQEFDYKNRLIEIFGYPYAGDIGAGKTYKSGYDGPDLYHHMYISTRTATGENAPPASDFTTFFRPLTDGSGWSFTPTDYTYDPITTDTSILTVNFPRTTANFTFDAPAAWGSRRAPGELQLALSDLVQSENSFKLALQNYDGLIQDIKAQNELLTARGVLKANIVWRLENGKTNIMSANSAILGMSATRGILNGVIDTVTSIHEVIEEALPTVVGLANDVAAPIRAVTKGALAIAIGGTKALSVATEIGELSQEQAKEVTSLTTEIEVQKLTEDFEILQMKKELEHMIRDEISLRLELYTQAEVVHQNANRYLQKMAEGERLIEELVRFRKATSAEVTEHRYEDMTFRIFRNDAIQKYRAAFDIAARYVYLAANAYDFEINFLRTDQRGGSRFLSEIVRQRNLGQMIDGEPSVGRPGLCDMLGRMVANWEVLKPQFGVVTPQIADTRFSLREELFRIRGDTDDDDANASWRAALQNARVLNLWEVPEFRRYCRPFAPEILGPQPGLVIRFPTTITFGQNFFGWPLAGGDSAYDPTQFSTKIARAGVWFSGSDGSMVSQTPRIYLVPVGMDIQRAPTGDTLATREWRIIDQVVPPPFPIGASDLDNTSWIPLNDSLGGNFAQVRRYGSFAAKHDDGIYSEDDLTNDTRLIGRSAWNTEWLMIIPGGTLLADPNEGVQTFINTVDDIKIYFQTYSYSGN